MYAALIIDADADAQFAIQNAFSDDPIDFRSVNSAQDGIEAAAGAKTDLVLIRIELPTSSGFSVFSKLRRNPATKHIPVVLYASDVADDVFTRHASLRTHAEGYLRLPIQQSELHSLIRPLLSLPAPEPAAPSQQLDVQLQNSDQQTPATASEWDTEISSEDVDSALDSLDFEIDPENENEQQFEISLSSDDALSDEDLEISSEEVEIDFAPLEELELPQGAAEPGAPAEPILLDNPTKATEPAPPSRLARASERAATPPPAVPEPVSALGPANPQAEASSQTGPEELRDAVPTELSNPLQAPAKRQSGPPPRKTPSARASSSEPASPAGPAKQSFPDPAPASQPFAPAASASTSSNSQSAIKIDPEPTKAPEAVKSPEPAANLNQAVQAQPEAKSDAGEASSRPASSNSSERRQLLAVKTQLLEKDRELLALREELERHEQDALEQRKERRGEQGQIAELQAAQLEFEESSIVAQERIEGLESEITRLKAANQEQQDKLAQAESALQNERERAQAQLDEQEKKNSESTALIASLEKQLQERDTTLHSRQEQLQDVQASLSGLLERLKAS